MHAPAASAAFFYCAIETSCPRFNFSFVFADEFDGIAAADSASVAEISRSGERRYIECCKVRL